MCVHLRYWLNCNPEKHRLGSPILFFSTADAKGMFQYSSKALDEILAFSKYWISFCLYFSANTQQDFQIKALVFRQTQVLFSFDFLATGTFL